MRTLVVSIAVGLVLGLGACRWPSTIDGVKPDQLIMADAGSPNTLAANDLLEVRVYQEADLSGVYRVDNNGHIDFPLCGKVQVGGLTASGAADAITSCLKNGFVRRPQVSALVKEFNSKKVFVFGEVSKPGAFSFEDGMTIIHAISQAGGLTRSAAKNSVNVTRVVDGKEVKLPVKVEDIVIGREKNFLLAPGDIIFVPESFI
ncbi:MAG: polysaccharide biosynthesis/export family protein [Myxococcota bacterium]